MAEETKKRVPKPPEIFHIHSMVRSVETRLQRAQSPTRHRFTQLLGGGLVRLVRKRPVPVAKALLLKLLPELVEKERLGLLKVTLPNGQRVDLSTLKPAEPPTPVEKKPERKLDSAADDKTFEHGVGEHKPQLPGGKAVSEPLDTPAVLVDIPEGEVEVTDELVQAIYDSGTRGDLDEVAESLELSTEGNKRDVARRLAEAGYKP